MIVHVIVSGTTIHQSPHSVGRCDHNAISPEDVGRAHCDIMDACLACASSFLPTMAIIAEGPTERVVVLMQHAAAFQGSVANLQPPHVTELP